jgi:hypothetical protein
MHDEGKKILLFLTMSICTIIAEAEFWQAASRRVIAGNAKKAQY